MSQPDLAMIDHARPRKKRMHAKVKTGCTTCKIRRVKCDEGKPECLRCTSTGRTCDGYITLVEKPAYGDVTTLDLVHQFPTTGKDSVELRAIAFFQHHAAPRICAFFESNSFWQQFVLQLGQSDVAVRQAIIAVSTVYEQAELGQGEPVFLNESLGLQSYNKAIRQLVKYKDTPDAQSKVTLIVCALFVCLEFMRGDISSAQRHIRGGLKMLKDRQTSSQQASPQASPQSSSASSSGLSTSKEDLDGELESIFSRLHLQSNLFDPPAVPQMSTDFNDETSLSAMAFEFSSIADARRWNITLSNLAFGFISSTFMSKYSGSVTVEQLVLHVSLMAQLQQWKLTFDHFIAIRKHLWNMREVKAANVLYAQHLSIYIWLAPCLSAEETNFDEYRLEFEKIVQLASETISDVNGNENSGSTVGNFQFEMGLIPPLHIAGTKCRWPDLRRQILKILGSTHWREGMFDSYRSYRCIYEIMCIEEDAIDPLLRPDGASLNDINTATLALPPESARVHHAELGKLIPGSAWQKLTLISKPNGVLASPSSWVTYISTIGELPPLQTMFE